MHQAADVDPLDTALITIAAVQFVGTNVEMTYFIDAPAGEAERRLDALFAAKLGLYAITASGRAAAPDGTQRPRFSVIASPLDRLFHKIGPSGPLTLIKHASLTLDLSETNLTRQAQGLRRTHLATDEDAATHDGPPPSRRSGRWPTWDAGKLLGTLLRKPALLDRGVVHVADVEVERGDFPHGILATLDRHVADHGGVRIDVPADVLAPLTDEPQKPA